MSHQEVVSSEVKTNLYVTVIDIQRTVGFVHTNRFNSLYQLNTEEDVFTNFQNSCSVIHFQVQY